MANLGRVYERLFERDFMYRPASGFWYLPKRLRFLNPIFEPSGDLDFGDPPFFTHPGEGDYDDGIVTWKVDFGDDATPGVELHITWELSFDENWANVRQQVLLDGVKIYHSIEIAGLGGIPRVGSTNFVVTDSGPTLPVVPPFGVPWIPKRWSD